MFKRFIKLVYSFLVIDFKVSREKTIVALWLMLDNLYMTKTLKMRSNTLIEDDMDEFNRLMLDLENIEIK